MNPFLIIILNLSDKCIMSEWLLKFYCRQCFPCCVLCINHISCQDNTHSFVKTTSILLSRQKFWENYSLWFCPLPFCPFALLPFCPFAPLPFCPHCIALAPAMALFKFWRLSREDIFFSHYGSCADDVDSPDVTLFCTDDN